MSSAVPSQAPVARAILQERDVPPPVVAFVRAVNSMDHAALVKLFALEALVNDQLRDFWGLAAISEWLDSEVVGARLQLKVLGTVRHFGDIVLTAEVAGDFDKTGLPTPLILDFHFSIHGDLICRLIILCKLQADASPEIRVPPPGPSSTAERAQ